MKRIAAVVALPVCAFCRGLLNLKMHGMVHQWSIRLSQQSGASLRFVGLFSYGRRKLFLPAALAHP
jgi:hypothetical protein